MSDWRDDDFEDDWVPKAPGEGVRVVGDPDAAYAPPPQASPPQAPYDAPPQAQAPRPVGRFPLPGGGGDEWADPEPRARRRAPDETPVELPHWTEPPTGQVPRVLGGDSADDDFEPWAQVTGSGPRFRTGDADWADADWGAGELSGDDTLGVGAPGDLHDEFAPPRRGRGAKRGRGRGRHEEEPFGPPPGSVPGSAPGPGPAMGPPPEAGGLESPYVDQHEGYRGGYAEGYEDYEAGGYEAGGYEAEAARSNVGPRLVTAAVVAAVALAAFAAGRGPAMILVTVIVGLCAFELYTAFQRVGYHPATLLGLVGCAAVVPLAYNKGERGILIAALLMGAFTFFWYLFEVVHARATVNIALSLLPFAWVGIFGAYGGMLLAAPVSGTGYLMGVVICAVGSDTVGYFVGRSMGRTPLLPRVSPNKTVEGLIAGAITAIALGGVVGSTLHPWADKGIGAGIVLGILVAIFAPLGDLVESMIKRDLGVKDLGGILPGHGGFLDRFDAVLFALPAAFYWALHLFS
ncbi:MAG: phosphatidate cytidylyltransferase [Acidimicrobiia bacterium]|nr:phosphatidate cytidylyltransferase [Acidimicrobiia bacterium]